MKYDYDIPVPVSRYEAVRAQLSDLPLGGSFFVETDNIPSVRTFVYTTLRKLGFKVKSRCWFEGEKNGIRFWRVK